MRNYQTDEEATAPKKQPDNTTAQDANETSGTEQPVKSDGPQSEDQQ